MFRIVSLTLDEAVETELDSLASSGRGFFTVDHAAQTAEVIAWTAVERYNAYVLDVSIDAKSVLGLCSLIRSWESDSVLIALSRKESDREHVLDAGADLFLHRPSETYRLREVIEGLLDPDRPAAASRQTFAPRAPEQRGMGPQRK
jgi:DNA-binding response OmpR family regulator